jgi:multidrug resistance efflux pump
METSVGRKITTTHEEIKGQKATIETALKKQSEVLEKAAAQARAELSNSLYKALLEGIRENILKAKVDLVAKNICNAKTELDSVADLLEKAKNMASAERRKTIEELQGSLKKAKAELDTDMSTAINRIELIWHEISGLMKEKA